MVIATDLTSICWIYKKNIVKKRLIPHTKNAAFIQIRKVVIFNSDRKQINSIPNKLFRYYIQ